jgi:hypothetical protein
MLKIMFYKLNVFVYNMMKIVGEHCQEDLHDHISTN